MLRWLRQSQKGEVHESVGLWNFMGTPRFSVGPDGPWHRRGGALTLPMFFRFVSLVSAQEQLFYYLNNGPMVIRTRDRSWGSKEATAAVWARMEAYGHWGPMSRSECRTGQ